jgi:hypothetical protein
MNRKMLFGLIVFVAGMILSNTGHPILGLSGGLIGIYFVFVK